MIEWSYPYLLWLLLLIPALAAFVWRRERQRQRALAGFADGPLVPRLAPDVDPRRRGIREALRLAALALLIVVIAGPKWGSHWEEVKREGVDIVVALDTSRSMLATDVKPNRIERAKLAIRDLLSKLKGDRIGLVAFAGTAFLECPLTLDYAAFDASLNSTNVGIIPRGGTNLAGAIDAGLEAFEARQGKYEALILITDGEKTEGEATEAAKRAAEQGVKIYTVGIGTPEGELIPLGQGESYVKNRDGQVVKSRLDEQGLQDIALASGGAYVHGAGASLGLEEIFDDHIAKMEHRELESTLQRRFEQRFQIPLALALLLLLIEPVLGERKRAATAALLLFLVFPARASADQVHEGNRLYHEGKYADAAQQYGDALIDSPGSPLLRFNLAAAEYKEGKYADAVASLQKIGPTGDEKLDSRVAYNLGNSLFRLGGQQAPGKPQDAIKSYEAALAAYKRAMGSDPEGVDAKVNHEVVEQKLADLKKQLEEQKKKQEEQQKQQDQQQQSQDQQKQQQDQGDQQQDQKQDQNQDEQKQQQQGGAPQDSNQNSEQAEQKPQPQPGQGNQKQDQDQGQAQGGGQPQAQPEQQEQGDQGNGEGGVAGENSGEKDLDRQEAYGVLDTARGEEVRPDELQRLQGHAQVAEPSEDW